ncbi:PadR family transcriptional regulator [Nocardioides ferulae]|uniref:PadR family transcriptional regulator n=1 Tax=Nocardioides ferulae TaxID=2340821 RepID=UPI000EB16B63|nr:PadR family transcriptional regulator [Nocardioides ferulae]
MALEHALLVALREQPAAGLELARRFERSIGFFWQATHQQIYRVLGRMEADGWLTVTEVPHPGRPAKKVYAVSAAGEAALAAWLVEPAAGEPLRSDLAVKLRGAAYADDPDGVRDVARAARADHATRLEHYHRLRARDYPHPDRLTGHELHQYLVLRGGIRLEEFWVDWLTEFLDATDPHPEGQP